MFHCQAEIAPPAQAVRPFPFCQCWWLNCDMNSDLVYIVSKLWMTESVHTLPSPPPPPFFISAASFLRVKLAPSVLSVPVHTPARPGMRTYQVLPWAAHNNPLPCSLCNLNFCAAIFIQKQNKFMESTGGNKQLRSTVKRQHQVLHMDDSTTLLFSGIIASWLEENKLSCVSTKGVIIR